jgi:hypothetical protein
MAETAVADSTEFASKLTIKTLGCDPSKVKGLPEGTLKLAIARFYGIAYDAKTQDNRDYGTVDTYFQGDFEGINMQDGTVLRSAKMFLPKGVTDIVEGALKQAKAKDKNASVSFAFEIRAVKASNKSGYTYEAATLMQPEQEDPLKKMRGALATKPVAVEGKAAATTATKKTA